MHPNIVHYVESFKIKKELWMVMEYMEGGTLETALKSYSFDESHVAFIASQILKALEFIHHKDFVHRDVTCGNVMLADGARVKLIDFGLCCDVSKGPKRRIAGTLGWIAPEMLRSEPYAYAVDIFSLGITILMTAGVPAKLCTMSEYYQISTEGVGFLLDMKMKTPLSADLRDFIMQCTLLDVKKRPSARMLLQHPFLKRACTLETMQEVIAVIFLTNTLNMFGFA